MDAREFSFVAIVLVFSLMAWLARRAVDQSSLR